jgi:serine/threonine-protein kinase
MNSNGVDEEFWGRLTSTVPVRGGQLLAPAPIPSGNPQVPSRFRILSELGRGGMAVVYHAYDTIGSREVALKFICQSDDLDAVKRFRREATDLAAVFHPFIVDFYSAGEVNGSEYIEMEYVAGGTLKGFVQNCDSLGTLLRVFAQICEGLEHIHQRGMVHRDIKPANILLTHDGLPKISDLGLARRSSGRSDITEMGTVMGTAAYLAPEQIMSHSVGPAADIYALGITLFEAVTGQHPFPAEGPLAIIRAHLQQTAPLASSALAGLPSRLDKLIAATLEKDPIDRPGSATEVKEQLELCIHELQAEQDRLTAASPQAMLERARRHLDGNRPEEALSLLERIPLGNLDPHVKAEVLTQQARALEQQGADNAELVATLAVAACRALSCPLLGSALLILGKAAVRAGNLQEALNALTEAKDAIPSSAHDQQIDLLETLAKLHESGGLPGLSGQDAARYREIAAGLRLRKKTSSSGTTYQVVFSEDVQAPQKLTRRLEAIAAVVCLCLFLTMVSLAQQKLPQIMEVYAMNQQAQEIPPELEEIVPPSRPPRRSVAKSSAPTLSVANSSNPVRSTQNPEEWVLVRKPPPRSALSSVAAKPVSVRAAVSRKPSKPKAIIAAPLQLPKPDYKLAAPRAASNPEPSLFPEVSEENPGTGFQPLKAAPVFRPDMTETQVAEARQRMRDAAMRANRNRSRDRLSPDGFGPLGMTAPNTRSL